MTNANQLRNKQFLRDKMKEYNYRRKDIADVMGVSLSSVHSWLLSEDSKTSRTFSNNMVDLLKRRLKSRKPYAKKKHANKK